MIPNMSDIVKDFSQPIIYQKKIVLDGGFEDTDDEIETNINAVVQIPSDETLVSAGLDYSVDLRQVHFSNDYSVAPTTDDEIRYSNKTYTVIRVRDFSIYGYWELIIEEVKDGSN